MRCPRPTSPAAEGFTEVARRVSAQQQARSGAAAGLHRSLLNLSSKGPHPISFAPSGHPSNLDIKKMASTSELGPRPASFELDDLAPTTAATSRRASQPGSTTELNPHSTQADDEDPAFHSTRRSGDRPREFPVELPPMVRLAKLAGAQSRAARPRPTYPPLSPPLHLPCLASVSPQTLFLLPLRSFVTVHLVPSHARVKSIELIQS